MRVRESALLLLLLIAGGAVPADEGMWTFDNFPKALVKQKLGVDVTDAWLDKVRLSTVRLSGCSGSFISSEGLILTNDHCSWSCLAQLSTSDSDLLANGFLASSRDQEKRCPTQSVSVLMGTEDVTAKIAAVTSGLDDQAANAASKKELSKLEEECRQASIRDRKVGELTCEAVTLYNGSQYFIYKYKRYTDARMVFAPEFAIGAFGGDPDNFQYPRWCLDMSILRVYDNGKPVRTPNYLRVNFAGPAAGDPVFIAGNPGSTDRLLTVEELKTLRDTYFPFYLTRYSELRGRYIQFGKTGAEPARIVSDKLQLLENSIKVSRKQFDALLDDDLMAAKVAKEDALRKAANADPALRALAGAAWDDVAKAQAIYRDMLVEYTFVESGAGFNTALYNHAKTLVRGAAERTKPGPERLREFADANIPKLEQTLEAKTPLYPDLEKLTLSYSLERMREWLGPDAPMVRSVLGSQSPDSLAGRLVDGSKLADPEVRMQLWTGGTAAIEASTDPMIVLAREVDPAARALRKRFEDEVQAPTRSASERIGKVRFAIEGTSTYPDATFTPRVNFGTVQAWTERSVPVDPFTKLGRLFERATGQDPFRVPDSWMAVKSELDLATPFNFTTNHDLVGGSSGSPMIDAKGDLVGLMFDGNIHSIANSYWFDTEKSRAVAVHPATMKEALTKVYRADALYREISAGK